MPAAIVGRFGRAKEGKPWRQATVRITNLSTGRSFCRSAESFAAERGAFDYSDGTRTVDHLWEPIEQGLGTAIDWTRNTLGPNAQTNRVHELQERLGVIQQYVADITVRSPGFDAACQQAGLTIDEVQDLRSRLAQQRRGEYSAGAYDLEVRVRYDSSVGSLLLNDLGFVRLTGAEDGLLVPLAPDVAVFLRLGPPVLEEPSLGIDWLDTHLAEARRAMAEARAATGHGPRWLYSHPDEDVPELA
ncbi:MAG: hypothetical protein JJT89_04815 [Nitriliruptoraceae bacterium]|nr:hypothetical protein [Nitriliruptoraceae bacterium]